jgi:hypothetical protein
MTAPTTLRQRLALGVAAVLAAGPLAAVAAAPAQAADQPDGAPNATVDFFDDTYAGLGPGSVYETVTYERFEYLLKSEGTYAFLLGGPDSATVNATIGHIDKVADQLGVDRIYNFNPKLDGGSLDIRDAGGSALVQAGQDAVEALWPKLTAYLNADTTPGFDQATGADPYLFVYDKDHRAGGLEDRIVTSLSAPKAAADLDTPAEVTAYENEVRTVLQAGGSTLDTRDNFDFYKTEVNRRHTTTPAYSDATKFGGDILEDSDAAQGWRIQSITYPELVDILESEGDFIILFGGTWCHNTRAVIKAVNEYAQAHGVTKVYNFDLSLDSTGNGGANYLHVRDNHFRTVSGTTTNNLRASYLYGDLVEKYFTNLKTQYGPSSSTVSYFPGGDTTREVKTAQKLQVPFPIHYNKDHRDAQGNPAPVEHQWIQTNTNAETGAVSFKEYMTEWWWVLGNLDGPYTPDTPGWQNNVPAQRAFAAEGIAELDRFFTLSAGGYESTTTATGLPATSVVGEDLQAQVTVTAPELTAKPTGTVEAVVGTRVIGEGTLTDGVATVAIPAPPAGTHEVFFRYAGNDEVATSRSAAQTLTVAKKASTTRLVTSAATAYGKAGTATVTVVDAAGRPLAGPVTLTGVGAARTAALVNGTATFDLPRTLAVKNHQLTAIYGGDDTFAASATPGSYRVTRTAPGKVTSVVAKKATAKKPGAVRVSVAAPAGLTQATGKVTVTLTKGKSTKKARGTLVRGKVVVKLPKLARGTWKAVAKYAGDASYTAASARTIKVKVAR